MSHPEHTFQTESQRKAASSATARRVSDVVFNGRLLTRPVGGVARVGIELLRALIQEIAEAQPGLSLRLATPVDLPPDMAVPQVVIKGAGYAGHLGEQLRLPLDYPGATMLSTGNSTPFFAYRSVVWIHDTHVLDSPETYSRSYRWFHRSVLTAVKLRRFEVVTVSNYARERLIHHGVRPDRVRVVYNGGDHVLREPEDTSILESAKLVRGNYVLLVGSPARHKNVPFAIEALLKHTPATLRIAVVGLTALSGPWYQASGDIPRHERIEILPKLSDAQLRALYAGAAVVLSPSFAEGFGLYAAEAMHAGSGPLVLSERTALPEVGGDAALYFDPTDAAALGAAVNTALQPDVQVKLRGAASVQRDKFRWRRAAREIIEYYF